MQALAAVPCAAAPVVARRPAAAAACGARPAAVRAPLRRRAPAARRAVLVAASAEDGAAQQLPSFGTTEPRRVTTADGKLAADLPQTAGVYAVYDSTAQLQYLGISRKIAVSLGTHVEAMEPNMVFAVKVLELPDAGKDQLQEAWKVWLQEAVAETGGIPPGNAPGVTDWQQRRPRVAKAELRLTPGKGLDDLTISLNDLIDQVVKSCKVVAFVKGTRTQPQCGFSYKVLTMLQEAGADFEVVNVLDEVYNPGLREAIKEYSAWPTIPQLYINGEFMGGADIVEQMHNSGELKQAVQAARG